MTGSGAEAGATVTLYDTNGTTVLGTAVADAGQLDHHQRALTDGVHSLTVTQTDIAGNTSVASSALNVTIDTVAAAPSAPDSSRRPTRGRPARHRRPHQRQHADGERDGAEAGATVTLYDTNGTTVLGTPMAAARAVEHHQFGAVRRRPQPDGDADRRRRQHQRGVLGALPHRRHGGGGAGAD